MYEGTIELFYGTDALILREPAASVQYEVDKYIISLQYVQNAQTGKERYPCSKKLVLFDGVSIGMDDILVKHARRRSGYRSRLPP